MKRVLSAIVTNWKMKALATALAVLLWIVVSGDQIVSTEEVAAVEVVNRDESVRVMDGPMPAEVTVRFVGPRREFYGFLTDRPRVRLILDRVDDETGEFALTPGMVVLPRGSDVMAQDIRPARVRLEFERLTTRDVPVRPTLPDRIADRFVIDAVEVDPPSVEVAGPVVRVAEVEALRTASIPLTPEDTIFERTVPLDVRNLEGLRLSHREVRVTGRLDPIVENVLPSLPVGTPGGLRPDPAQVRVTFEGPRRIVDAVDLNAVRVAVDPADVPAVVPDDGVDVPVTVEGLPDAVVGRADPEAVRVFAIPPPPPAPELPDDDDTDPGD